MPTLIKKMQKNPRCPMEPRFCFPGGSKHRGERREGPRAATQDAAPGPGQALPPRRLLRSFTVAAVSASPSAASTTPKSEAACSCV